MAHALAGIAGGERDAALSGRALGRAARGSRSRPRSPRARSTPRSPRRSRRTRPRSAPARAAAERARVGSRSPRRARALMIAVAASTPAPAPGARARARPAVDPHSASASRNASSAPSRSPSRRRMLAELDVTGRRVARAHARELRARPARPLARRRSSRRGAAAPTRGAPGTRRGRRASGWRFGPPRRRLGPLGGAAVVAELLARADQAAVHLAGRVRPEPPLDREEHRLVEVPEPVARVALVDRARVRALAGPRPRGRRAQPPAELERAVRRARSPPRARPARARPRPRGGRGSPYSAHSVVALETLPRPAQPRARDRSAAP